MNNVVRVDWRPTANDSFYFTFKDWYSDQRGSEITAGPNKWGFFNTHYLNTDRGVSANYTKMLSPNDWCCDSDFGIRQQTEQFYPLTEARLDADQSQTRSASRVGQFHPELNPRNVIPKVTFNVPERAELHVRQPAGRSGRGLADVVPNEPDLDPRQPLAQGRATTSSSRSNSEGKGGVGAGPWAGQFNFSTDVNNPLDTNYSYANALLGTFRDYTEIDAFSEVHRQALHRRVLRAGHVEGDPAPDGRLRRALPVVHAVVSRRSRRRCSFPSGTIRPRRRGSISRRVVNSVNVAFDPVTVRRCRTCSSAASFPEPAIATTAWSAAAIRITRRASATTRASSRSRALGMAWDIAGDGKTAHPRERRAVPQPARQRERHGRDGEESAGAEHAAASSTGRWTRCWPPGPQGAFSNRPSACSASSAMRKTPQSYNYSAGIQRELGWGTVST